MSQLQQTFWENCKRTSKVYDINREELFSGHLTAGVINIILAAVAVFVNTITIIIFRCKKRLRSITDILLCSLAVTDLLAGLIAMPTLAIDSPLRAYGQKTSCYVFLMGALIRIVCIFLTVITSILLALDRYTAIFYPFEYEAQEQNIKFAMKILAILWSTAILLVIGSLATKHMILIRIMLVALFASFILFGTWVHLRTFFVSRRIQKQILD